MIQGNPSNRDNRNLQSEVGALITEVTRVSTNTTYNGKALLGSDASTINIPVGYINGDQTALKTYSVSASSLGLESADFQAANEAEDGITARSSQMAIVASNGGDVIQYCLGMI